MDPTVLGFGWLIVGSRESEVQSDINGRSSCGKKTFPPVHTRKLTWLAGKSPCLIGDRSLNFKRLFLHCHVSLPEVSSTHIVQVPLLPMKSSKRSIMKHCENWKWGPHPICVFFLFFFRKFCNRAHSSRESQAWKHVDGKFSSDHRR